MRDSGAALTTSPGMLHRRTDPDGWPHLRGGGLYTHAEQGSLNLGRGSIDRRSWSA
jgi:hypothetical protein